MKSKYVFPSIWIEIVNLDELDDKKRWTQTNYISAEVLLLRIK